MAEIGAIVQARMNSKRLPNKVLRELAGKPMLWHIINRISFSNYIEKIVIAAADTEEDRIIVEFAKEYGIEVFTGSENDVLDRFYNTAKKFNLDPIVKISGDCPLIDPAILDNIIEFFVNNKSKYDYVSNTAEPTYPEGMDVEVFSFKALEKTFNEAKEALDRENITPYILRNKEAFRIYNYKNDKDYSKFRLTVDELEDFELIKQIFKRLYSEDNVFTMEQVIDYLETNPSLLLINKQSKEDDKCPVEGQVYKPEC